MVDKLNAKFEQNCQMAILISNLFMERDKKLAQKWIDKISGYNSRKLDVAIKRNELMETFLTVLRNELHFRAISTKKAKLLNEEEKAKLRQEVDHYGEPNVKSPILETVFLPSSNVTSFMSIWSPDKRTYMAAKPIGGEGALIYMAVSSDPEMGWDLPDVSTGQFRHTC